MFERPIAELNGVRAAVLGCGRSGMAAARALAKLGAEVFVSDAGTTEEVRSACEREGWDLELGGHTSRIWRGRDLIVVSPGVPWNHSVLEDARRAGKTVIGEVELAWRLTEAPFVAITGSNGKSTTTSMIGVCLERLGLRCEVAGNIGRPLSGVVPGYEGWVVAEISSYQLEGVTSFRPRVGVLLNVSPDHLDRHGGFSAYVEAKMRLFEHFGKENVAVLGADDVPAEAARRVKAGRILHASLSPLDEGVAGAFCEEDGTIRFRSRPGEVAERLMHRSDLPIPGRHNLANALAAIAAVGGIVEPDERVAEALAGFRALPHRQEVVAEWEGVKWVDDSKATNVASAVASLESYEGPIVWIAGGRDKGSDLLPLVRAAAGRVRRALLIGESADRLERALRGGVPTLRVGTMEAAVRWAMEHCTAGDVVLLAPACASFDQFRDFEDRGETFRRLVHECRRSGEVGGR